MTLPGTPADQRDAEVLDGLGAVRHRLRPNRINLAIGMILSIPVMAGGIVGLGFVLREAWIRGWNVPLYSETEFSWYLWFMGMFVFAGLIFGGAALLRWAILRWTLRVTVCSAGFEWRRMGRTDRYLWEDMEAVREFRPDIPASNDFQIQIRNGPRINLTKNDLINHGVFGKIAMAEARTRGIPAEGGENHQPLLFCTPGESDHGADDKIHRTDDDIVLE